MRLLKTLIALVLCLNLPLAAFAHSGKTDSNGGHTNRSTGEYHYHHGYPAHQHYDMDGDGDLDCPFNFEDKTGTSNRSESSKTETTSADANQNMKISDLEGEPKNENVEKKTSAAKFSLTTFCWVFMGFFVLLDVVSRIVDEIKWRLKK